MSGKTIVTYLISGEATSVKTVEFSNRLIKGVYIPRKDFKEAKEREELQKSGIYFLLGEDEDGNSLAYIGQATVLNKRLNDHYNDSKKDFWNIAVAFTYKDGTLNESDINFLEKELITAAKKANRYNIKNANGGNFGLIQEHRISDMKEFISDLQILLESLGFKLFKELVTKEKLSNEDNVYYLKSRGADAKMVYTNEGVVVLKGSMGPISMQKGVLKNKGYSYRKRPLLIDKKIIQEEGDYIVFVEDYLFSSPSSAASLVSGASLNGWVELKNIKNQTLDEVERQKD